MRRAGRDERRLGGLWFVAASLALAMKPLWILASGFSTTCGMHALAGIPCPTCGTTRAALAFLDGRILEALHWNPLAAAAALVFVGGGLAVPVWFVAGAPIPAPPRIPLVAVRIAAVAAVAANWIYLIANRI